MPDHSAVASKLDAVFYPQSIAVVGASTRPGTVGNDIFRNLLYAEFNGSVYPVNPKAKAILGVHAYATLADIPSSIDLAVLIVPAAGVLGVVDQAIAKGVKALVVISAGFKEIGPEGAALEAQLRDKVRAAGIPLIGPNCLGVINTDPKVSMNAAFGRKMPEPGNLAFLSQSGAPVHLGARLRRGAADGLQQVHQLRQQGRRQRDRPAGLPGQGREDLGDRHVPGGRDQRAAVHRDGPRHLLGDAQADVVPEVGPLARRRQGRQQPHRLAGRLRLGVRRPVDPSGVQRVDTIAELFDYAALYTTQPLPRGDRVAIITNAGGPGIMATDAAVRHGLKLAELSEATKEKLRPSLPATASLRNPIDVIGDARADRYKAAVRTVLEDENVDMGIVILTPQSMTDIEETAAVVPEAVKGIDKPVVCSFMGAKDVAPGVKILRAAGIPNYAFPEDGVKSLAAANWLVALHEIPRRQMTVFNDLDVEGAKQIVAELLNDHPQRYLTQADCRPLLSCYGLPLLKSAVAKDADDAARAAESFGVPVVMKVMSADVVHKYDAGGVILNVHGEEEARAAYKKILKNVEKHVPGAKIEGILVEEMARKGVEVILGASRDERFGPLMMFGLGGTLVEVLKDVSFRLAPMWQMSAERMVRQIRSFKVLDGFRGNPPCDIGAIVDTLLRLSAMVCNHPEISECDINPLIVHAKGQGCSVADSRIMLRRTK